MLLFTGTGLRAHEVNPFGVVEGMWLPDTVCQLGVGWERIIFDWAQHQPTGPDDWHTLNVDDRWLKAANDCGREVVAVIKHTPAWATDGTPGPGLPRGLYLPVDDPNNVWANFMRRAAAYYGSRGVWHFIIWNEPDISPDIYGFEFEGTLEDYYQLLRVAYLAARQGNPAAVIHLAGTTYWHDVNAGQRLYLDRLLERITHDPDAAANDYYFDVLSLHIYFRTETVYHITSEMRALLQSYGMADKEIWINETNAAPTDDPLWPVERPVFQLNLEQQASFVVQAAALGLAAGAQRIAVYKFYDVNLPPGGESFGLLRADASLRPAFYAWQAVAHYLDGVIDGTYAQTETADVVRLTHANGRETLVFWARTQQATQIRVQASGSKAYLIDQYGGVQVLRPVDGYYTLSLRGARCNSQDVVACPVGGQTWLLAQRGAGPLVQEITARGTAVLEFE
ncbi:MAG: hypothetical protein HXY40_07550 [Chloroflexi bacterium]|nr:hypothetical protein [Chloroflexota bacterium]